MKLLTIATLVALLLGLLIGLAIADIRLINESSFSSCIETERQALLMFKQNLIDRTSRLVSWAADAKDCCRWIGVVCDNRTGHVIELRLGLPPRDGYIECDVYERSKLVGKINPCLSNLKHLRYLDLSNNAFQGMLPYQLGNLNSLAFLNLGKNDFHGPIPHVLHNMSTSLRYLNLSQNNFNSSIPDWIYSMSALEVLGIGGNYLQGEISSAIGNMTCLNELDLSGNELEGKLPASVGKLCNLRLISLSGLRLNQSISRIFEILSKCSVHELESVDLDSCHLYGGLTDELGRLQNLRILSLSGNSISGPIPTCLGQLANLESVHIQNNLLEGIVSELHFANHTKLRKFGASGNSLLMLKVHPNWLPPFQLRALKLRSWHIGPSFPLWLCSQKHLEFLDLSNSKISDRIPPWFWGLTTHMIYLNLSHNQIPGQLEYLPNNNLSIILDLSFNSFSGKLPRVSAASSYERIDLSSNYFSGSLFHLLCYQLNHTMITKILILSKNILSGELPICWFKWQMLQVLRLDDNRFIGRIPKSMGILGNLESLNLYRNNLHGDIPISLGNCRNLVSINLGDNQVDGNIPGWIGHSFPNLVILSLRSNKLWGNIPSDLCDLRSLQILDVANNNLSGTIPRCIYNLSAMAERNNGSKISSKIDYGNLTGPNYETAWVIMKGLSLEYGSTLNLVRVIDFSSNNLSGEIPQELTILRALQSLNLSHNTLSGKIPQNMGAMQSLESLDLSQNHLSGSIPTSISSMTFLSRLDLSYNNLTGEIPSSTQLQGFNASSYTGNNLCGPPLKHCVESGTKPNKTGNLDLISDGNIFKVKGLYISISLGFIVGFWSIVAPLMINTRWRFTYYGFLEQMWRRLHDFFKV